MLIPYFSPTMAYCSVIGILGQNKVPKASKHSSKFFLRANNRCVGRMLLGDDEVGRSFRLELPAASVLKGHSKGLSFGHDPPPQQLNSQRHFLSAVTPSTLVIHSNHNGTHQERQIFGALADIQ